MRYYVYLIFLLVGLLISKAAISQTAGEIEIASADTLPPDSIYFTPHEASDFIGRLLQLDSLWRPNGDTLKYSLVRLVDHFSEPFDSVKTKLSSFEYDSIAMVLTDLVKKKSFQVRWLNDSTFIFDTIPLSKEPFREVERIVLRQTDTLTMPVNDTLPETIFSIDTVVQVMDTIREVFIDTLFLESENRVLYQFLNDRFIPPVTQRGSNEYARMAADSSYITISETWQALVGDESSPFFVVPNESIPDSLKLAVESLLSFVSDRDSILLFFNNNEGQKTPFWLTNEDDELYRFWVKNNANDSITLWIGNPSKYDIALILEDNVNVERMEKKSADDIPITTLKPLRTLATLSPLEEIPIKWNYGVSSAFTLNETFFSNWSRGGETSLSSMLDIGGNAEYVNKAVKSRWVNTGRLRYGTIVTEEHGFRTNTDMLELNSQFNKVIKNKVDFSSVFFMKTQVAKGYKYPNDSVVVSKFLNPGTFTIGVGIEYKPFPKTRINFSPLSYKNTFVLDTANINQKLHGIDADKRARQEMGGQLVVVNRMSVLNGLNISNSVRLFSGYLDKPENIDVDWEINLEKQISWFFTVKLNMHFIYDDDILFAVEDRNGEPVLLPDGSEKKVPKLQFKQFLGLTLAFKL